MKSVVAPAESELFSRTWAEQAVLEAMIAQAQELGENGVAVVVLFDAIIESISHFSSLPPDELKNLADGSFETLYRQVVALLGEGHTIAFLNAFQIAITNKMERIPDGSRGPDDPGSHYTPFALGKLLQSFRTGRDSTDHPNTPDGKVRRGESPIGGAVLDLRKKIITAFSGAPNPRTDKQIARAGVAKFEQIMTAREKKLNELRANRVHGEWTAERRARHNAGEEERYLIKAIRALTTIGTKEHLILRTEGQPQLTREESMDLYHWALSHVPKPLDVSYEQASSVIQRIRDQNQRYEINRLAESIGYTQLIGVDVLGDVVPTLLFVFAKEENQELVSVLSLPDKYIDYLKSDSQENYNLYVYQRWFIIAMLFYSHATDGDYHRNADKTVLADFKQFILTKIAAK